LKKIIDPDPDTSSNRTTNNHIDSKMEIILLTKRENDNNRDDQSNERVDNNEIGDWVEIGKLSQQTSFEDITPLEFGEISQGPWVNYGIKSGMRNSNNSTSQENKKDVTQYSGKDLKISNPTSSDKDNVGTMPDAVDLPTSGIIQASDSKDKNIPELKKSKKSGSSQSTSIEMENVPGAEKNVPRESSPIPKYESLREAIRIR
jgi:hypothetical protein